MPQTEIKRKNDPSFFTHLLFEERFKLPTFGLKLLEVARSC